MKDLLRKGVVEDILKKLKLQSPIYAHPTKPATHLEVDEDVLQAEIVEKGTGQCKGFQSLKSTTSTGLKYSMHGAV